MAKSNPAGDALTPDQIQGILRDAVEADKSAWGYCPKCKKKVKADFPDHSARIKALQLALEHGYGRPGTAQQDAAPVDLDVDVTKLTPEDRATLRKALVAKTEVSSLYGDDQGPKVPVRVTHDWKPKD